jgi:hypothetical protein
MDEQQEQVLLSRIEDQLIAKFNKRFAGASNRDDVLETVINWLYFFYAEKTIRKDGMVPQVLAMKHHVCDQRIGILVRKLEKLGLYNELPIYLQEQCAHMRKC